MRLLSLVGTGFVLVAISASGALAQNSRPDIALATSSYGGMSCSQFVGMGPGDRDAIVRKMVGAAPATSLADIGSAASGIMPTDGSVMAEQARSQPPLDSGRLVSACQATNSTSTLREAFAHSLVTPQIDFPSSD